MKKLFLLFLLLPLVLWSAPAPPIRQNQMTTNPVTGTFGNGEVPTWDNTAKAWTNGVATGASLSSISNISVNTFWNLFTNAHTNSNVFYLDTAGDDATARIGDPFRPWHSWTNWMHAINTSTIPYKVGHARPGTYNVTKRTSATFAVSYLSGVSNLDIVAYGARLKVTTTNECMLLAMTNVNNVKIYGLEIEGSRLDGTTNNRSGLNHGEISLSASATSLKFEDMYIHNITRHGILPTPDCYRSNIVYSRLTFYDFGSTNSLDMSGTTDGAAIYPCAYDLVENCYFIKGTRGIEFEGYHFAYQHSAGARVRNCTFLGMSHAGVLVFPDFTTANYHSWSVDSCLFDAAGRGGSGVSISGGYGWSVRNSWFKNNYIGIHVEANTIDTYEFDISNNDIRDSTQHGIAFEDFQSEVGKISKGNISRNTVAVAGYTAIAGQLTDSIIADNQLSGTAINDAAYGAIDMSTGADPVLDPNTNNIIRGNHIYDVLGVGIRIAANVRDTVLEFNTFRDASASAAGEMTATGVTNLTIIRATPTGIGIGTNAPDSDVVLQVHGRIKYPIGAVDGYVPKSTNGGEMVWMPDATGGAGTPGGTNMQVQFNQGGAFGGATNVWYDSSGFLGIGTNQPLTVLHVSDGDLRLDRGNFDLRGNGAVFVQSPGSSTNYFSISGVGSYTPNTIFDILQGPNNGTDATWRFGNNREFGPVYPTQDLASASTPIRTGYFSNIVVLGNSPAAGKIWTGTGTGGTGAWSNLVDYIDVPFGEIGGPISTGLKGYKRVPYGCTIVGVSIINHNGLATGSIVVDIWKEDWADFVAGNLADADSITASAQPTLTTARGSEDTTLTGWTTAVAPGDVLAFNVDSASTITNVTLQLKVLR